MAAAKARSRIDADVPARFKATGRGYRTRINNVLRAFFESRQKPTKADGSRQ